MTETRPDAVVLAAAKVGGILANDRYPAEFLRDNLLIETNVIHVAFQCDVGRLLFLGSSCIYPNLAPQPIPEDALLTGPLEPPTSGRQPEQHARDILSVADKHAPIGLGVPIGALGLPQFMKEPPAWQRATSVCARAEQNA